MMGFRSGLKDGYFIKKIPSSLIFYSFEIQKEDIFLCYAGAYPNMEHYQSSFPEQCRYMVVQDNVILHAQLKFKYNKNLLKVAVSRNNFSFYRDTILLTEFMKPEIYSIDSTGNLTPRYKVEFSTNTFYRSFDEDVDLQQMESKEKSGSFTTLFGSFYETDNYILMNYARGFIGTAYVNKREINMKKYLCIVLISLLTTNCKNTSSNLCPL
jgi:hypothetical protein